MLKRRPSRNAFVYVVANAITLSCAITYALVAHLAWWQNLLLTAGSVIFVSMVVFSYLEVARLGRISRSSTASPVEEDVEVMRVVVVEPPTGAPYPHHEDHDGSQGQDQGQLTSRLAGSTPLVDLLAKRQGDR